MRRLPIRWLLADRQEGNALVELILFVGLILLPTLMLVTSLPTWWERQSLGRLAAQEAARTVALADSWEQGVPAAQAIVAQLASNHDVDPADLSVAFGGALRRGQAVSATVTIAVPSTTIPLLTSLPAFHLTSTHREQVDHYRTFSAS